MKKTVAAVFAAVIALSASCFAVSAAQTDGDPATVGIGEQAQEAFPEVSGTEACICCSEKAEAARPRF